MATASQWVEGARPRTLPNAIAPVLVGAGAAAAVGQFVWWKSLLALVVSLALIVGVNFANDYSDGIRGTDTHRVGPLRLVGSGVARPTLVRAVAFVCFGLAALSGLVLVVVSGLWWLVLLGALCIAGAWFYTGGSRPYGYAGFGEVAVFVFFGLAGVLGTLYVQSGAITGIGIADAIAVGSFSSAVLVANNLRDIPTDTTAGKRTLAVLLGDARTRWLYQGLVTVPALVSIGAGVVSPWALLGLLALPVLVGPVRTIRGGANGMALIPVLKDTGLAMLLWAVVTGIALSLG
jgi:1,4-dihydroxy-2-naphthoate octaprenyltransferase